MVNFITTSFVVGASLSLLMGIVLFLARTNQPANRFFAISLMAAQAVSLSLSVRSAAPGMLPEWVQSTTLVFGVLGSTCLYFYVSLLSDPYFEWRKQRRVLYPIGFAFAWVLTVAYLEARGFFNEDLDLLETYLRGLFKAVFLIGYFGVMFKKVFAFKKRVEEGTANEAQLRLRWMLLIGFSYAPILFVRIVDALVGPKLQLDLYLPPLFTLVTLTLAGFALSYSAIFSKSNAEDAKLQTTEDGQKALPTKRYLSESDLERYGSALERAFKEEELHLTSGLRLVDVAEKVGIKPYLLSELLRERFHTNFFDYVNRMRIEEAKRRLADPKSAHLSILAVAEECGFNSKSVFNDAFKKIAGSTPSEFRSRSTNA